MKRHIVQTEDGSSSIFIPEMNEHYHSKKGAMTESIHVYIENGLFEVNKDVIHVLEVGLGTGLNVLLTAGLAKTEVVFHSLEPYPLNTEEWQSLHFQHPSIDPNWLEVIHKSAAGDHCSFGKITDFVWYREKLESFQPKQHYDLVYFDAFAPNKQDGPWQMSNVRKIYNVMNKGGLLTTYCASGSFKRNLRSAGFAVENPPGPMGKREMTIARKN